MEDPMEEAIRWYAEEITGRVSWALWIDLDWEDTAARIRAGIENGTVEWDTEDCAPPLILLYGTEQIEQDMLAELSLG